MLLPPTDVNMACNTIPAVVKHVHLMAVCGTAMGALACLLKDAGYAVSGSDRNTYPPMSTFLQKKGITLRDGYAGTNLQPPPDLVVVGNAVSRGNPEVEALLAQAIPFCSMPQAINHFVVGSRRSLMVCGTHGKTTTAALLAWILETAQWHPGFVIGGILHNTSSNFRMGTGAHVVLEGDEYDTAFFDKGSKFLHYHPDITILTGIEFDHADIFKDLKAVERAFETLLADLAPASLLLVYDQDRSFSKLQPVCHSRMATYGTATASDWRLSEVAIDPPWTSFSACYHGKRLGRFQTRLMGNHNLLNALAALAAAHDLTIPPEAMAQALKTFSGVKRRQEIRGQVRGITVIDDFAHHPTAVAATIQAVKPFFPDGRLFAVFEPRTNTSMRNVFQTVYAASFADADMIAVVRPALLNKVPPELRFSSTQLVDELRHNGQDARHFENVADIIEFICRNARAGDVVLIMSNGGFDNIHARLLTALV